MEESLQEIIKDNDAVLIKGSRANRMENIYKLI
jgi:UDP-N-acetylmuramyl pentapeptide synthase